MSPAFVADASVGIAWAVPTQSSPAAERLLDEVALGRPFVIPALWPFEVANSLLVLKRRKKLTGEQYALARRALSSLRPVVDDEGPRVALGRISEIAEENGLSVYDAAYLELSLRKNLPLASRDTDLNRAAKRRGLATLL